MISGALPMSSWKPSNNFKSQRKTAIGFWEKGEN